MGSLSFLNSIFLWGLTAASIPIIIHLIKRNKAVKVQFAAMRFLQVDPNKRVKSQRLKQLLLLLMRIVALAILAFAFARPFFSDQETAAFWGDQPKVAVVMVDNSYSMAVADNFNVAVSKAKDLVKRFRTRDEVTIVQFGETSEVVGRAAADFTGFASQLETRLRLSNQATDYLQAIQMAESILLESPLNDKQIYIISDFQKSGWETLNPHWTVESELGLEFIPVGTVAQVFLRKPVIYN